MFYEIGLVESSFKCAVFLEHPAPAKSEGVGFQQELEQEDNGVGEFFRFGHTRGFYQTERVSDIVT